MYVSNLFLLHQLGIGTIVYNAAPEYRCCEIGIYLFRVHVLWLSIKDEVIAFSTQIDRCLLSQKDKGKNVAILCFMSITFVKIGSV